MTPYTKLKLHVARHKYKRGQYEGSAPADASRRGKSHFRVDYDAHRAFVTFHNTRILTCHADSDTIKLDSGGWHAHQATREAMRDAIKLATGETMWMCTDTRNGYTQTAIGGHVFYDGMEFRGRELVSEPRPFKMYRVDREATKAVRDLAKDYRAMLPVLNATCDPSRKNWGEWRSLGRTEIDRIKAALQNPEHWPALTAVYYNSSEYRDTWNAMYCTLTAGLRVVVEVTGE